MAVSLAAQLGTAPWLFINSLIFLFIFTGQSDSGTFSACYNLWIGSKFCLVSFYGIAYMGGKRIERGVLRLLNDSMQWVGDLPVSHSGDIHLSLLQVGILYVLLFVVLSYLLSPSRKTLITVFVWNQSFIGFSGCLYYERGVFSVNPGPFASKSFPQKDVWQQDSIYHYKGMNICVLVDNRWQEQIG